jgi:hypothetical protein
VEGEIAPNSWPLLHRREKKIWLIERVNRNWKDLSEGWYENKGIAPRLALKRSLGVTDHNE